MNRREFLKALSVTPLLGLTPAVVAAPKTLGPNDGKVVIDRVREVLREQGSSIPMTGRDIIARQKRYARDDDFMTLYRKQVADGVSKHFEDQLVESCAGIT
jgi:hypothetical protein